MPEIWSAKLLTSLKKNLVAAQPSVVNRNYEGEIAQAGDTVHINSISRPTIGTYTPNSTTITPENLTTAQRTLIIDQSKYFAFEVDDVDARQAAGDMLSAALLEAAYGLRDLADQYVISLYAGVDAANALGTVAVPVGTATAAYDSVLVPLKVKLDEANVPTEGRYVLVPSWFHGRLLLDARFIKVNESGTAEGLRNGMVGRAAGFDILVSNNMPLITGDDYLVLAGHPMAITYAEQINKVEGYRPENAFSDAVKGLHLYGAKLVRTNAIATAVASIT
ncbi:MAG: P22 coat protein - protein 5 domain protein [Acidimicrobiia bacterium]